MLSATLGSEGPGMRGKPGWLELLLVGKRDKIKGMMLYIGF